MWTFHLWKVWLLAEDFVNIKCGQNSQKVNQIQLKTEIMPHQVNPSNTFSQSNKKWGYNDQQSILFGLCINCGGVTSSNHAWRQLSAPRSRERDGGGSTKAGERGRWLLSAAFSPWHYQMVRVLTDSCMFHVHSQSCYSPFLSWTVGNANLFVSFS